jgi:hypothetical protein
MFHLMRIASVALLLAWAVAACGGATAAAARDPMKCERDPNCKSHERAFDCSTQCSDDPACLDRCNQVQEQTGTSQQH